MVYATPGTGALHNFELKFFSSFQNTKKVFHDFTFFAAAGFVRREGVFFFHVNQKCAGGEKKRLDSLKECGEVTGAMTPPAKQPQRAHQHGRHQKRRGAHKEAAPPPTSANIPPPSNAFTSKTLNIFLFKL